MGSIFSLVLVEGFYAARSLIGLFTHSLARVNAFTHRCEPFHASTGPSAGVVIDPRFFLFLARTLCASSQKASEPVLHRGDTRTHYCALGATRTVSASCELEPSNLLMYQTRQDVGGNLTPELATSDQYLGRMKSTGTAGRLKIPHGYVLRNRHNSS